MAEMSSTRRRRQKPSEANTLLRSLSPDCYIDLTVDSPVREPTRTRITERDDTPVVLTISHIPTWTVQRVDPPIPADIIHPENSSVSTRTIHRVSIEYTPGPGLSSNNNNNLQENVQNETVVIDDADPAPILSPKNSPKVHDKSAAPCLSCPICFEELLNTSMTAYTTKCGHIFCETCLKRAIETRKKCPMCLKVVNIKQCVRLHI